MRQRAFAFGIATALVVALLPMGIGSAAAAPSVAPTAASTLDWGACADPVATEHGFECATLDVPLDRTGKDKGTVSLALIRHVSTGTADERVGALLFNPGGPGGPGVQSLPMVWPALSDEIQTHFDLVSWDPRGVGATTPALQGCEQPFVPLPLTGALDLEAAARSFQRTLTKANADCQAGNALIAEHMGTNDVVADLDAIRAALGEDQLTYWGMSYGTRIGYVYAVQHPERVRAIVLDGSIDPAATNLTLTQGAAGPDQAFGSFANAYPQASAQLDALLTQLGKRPVWVADGVRLDRPLLLSLVYENIAHQPAYQSIAGVIDAAYLAVFGTPEQQAEMRPVLARTIPAIRASVLGESSNAGGVFSIVNCTDYADRPTFDEVLQAVRYEHRLAPRYSVRLSVAFGLGCSGLTVKPDPIPVITSTQSNVPVLILGSSRDGATVSQWTTRMSRAFPSSRTVIYAGGQHVTWFIAGSECVNAVATDYVLNRTLPATDIGCPNAYVAP